MDRPTPFCGPRAGVGWGAGNVAPGTQGCSPGRIPHRRPGPHRAVCAQRWRLARPAGAERSRASPKPRGAGERAGRSAPPRAWEPRRGRGGGVAGCEWSGHFLFLCSFPQLWVVAAAGLRLPVGGGRGGVDSGPGTPRPAVRSRAPARLPRPEPAASRLSARPPPPRPSERPRCRPSSVWWWETGECGARGRGPGPDGSGSAGGGRAGGRARGLGLSGAWAGGAGRHPSLGPGGARRVPAFFLSFWWGRESPTAAGGKSELHPPLSPRAR